MCNKQTQLYKRVLEVSKYIIETGCTVRTAAKVFGVSKSTIHTEVTLKNGREKGQVVPESIEIKGVFLAEKNPVVRLGLVIK